MSYAYESAEALPSWNDLVPGSFPTNLYLEDGNLITCTATALILPRWIIATTSGANVFSIPLSATIAGVVVQPKAKASAVVNPRFKLNARLTKDGLSDIGDSRITSGTLNAVLTKWTLGGANDMWGIALTPAEVNNLLGIKLWVSVGAVGAPSRVISVDDIEITVYYTTPSPSGAFFSSLTR
jgi:hypothetical protein